MLLLATAIAVGVGWLVVRGLQARAELVAAQAGVEQVRAAATSGDVAASHVALAATAEHADRARAYTSDPIWRLAGWVPYLGRTPLAITESAAAVDAAVTDVLPDLSEAAATLDPKHLRVRDRIDVAAVAGLAPRVVSADARLAEIQADLDQVNLSFVLPAVSSSVRELRTVVADTRATLDAGATVARLLPAMLGASGVRHYLVVLQNNAEARGTGGLVGAFAVLEVRDGRPTLVRLGSDSELESASTLPVDLGSAFRSFYGNDPALWSNTNLSAHFPFAARLELELWRRQFGQRLDGVIAADPVAIGYLLEATGPVDVPGVGRVGGAQFADVAMRQVYARFPAAAQEAQRTAYLQAIAHAAFDRLLGSSGNPSAVVAALGRAAGERRLLVFSAHDDEQSLLAPTSVGGVVDDRAGPYAAVVVDNEAGNKLDYYLDRTLTYTASACGGGPASIVVTVRDNAPATGLPSYAAYRQDRGPTSTVAGRGGDGSTRVRLLVYAAVGAEVNHASLDGAPVTLTAGLDGAGAGRPVYAVSVELRSGQQRTLTLALTEPGRPPQGMADVDATRVWVGPLVRVPITTVEAPTCR